MQDSEEPETRRAGVVDEGVALLQTVADYGGVNAAAEVLGRSPSGVSRRIQRLAVRLRTPLLRRTGRMVELTEAGEALLRSAPELHTAQERTLAALADAADPEAGVLSIAANTFALATVLTTALGEWESQHPRSRWRLREAEPRLGRRLLADGEADIVLMPVGESTPAADDPRFLVLPVAEEPVDLILPADHRLAGSPRLPLTSLVEDPWILGTVEQGSREEILAACRSVGFRPAAAHQAQDWAALSALVAAGAGVSMLPRLSPTHPGVARIPAAGPPNPVRHIVAVLRRGSEQRGLTSAAIALIRSTAEAAILRSDPHR